MAKSKSKAKKAKKALSKAKTKAKVSKSPKKAAKKKPDKGSPPEGLLIRGANVITMDDAGGVGPLDVRVQGEHITEVGPSLRPGKRDRVLNAKGLVMMPGFVQAHVHLCQMLFRAQADDMELLPWLRDRIWPLEGALEAEDLRASARLGIAELLLGGTTSILDMGTVRHTDVIFEEAERLGLRYTGGKTMMDLGQGYPVGLRETTQESLDESEALCQRWHGKAGGRLRYAFSPRFVLSATEEAMKGSVQLARKYGALLHTHSSENPEEVEIVRQRTGMGNVEYLHSLGFSGPDVLLAHGVWLTSTERRILRETRTTIVHCPSANLKLASGIARIAELLNDGIRIAIGGDGVACNNTLDGFIEMRLTALLHKVRSGPTAVPAATALRLATRGGAESMGLVDVGSIQPGKRADLMLLDLNKPHAAASGDVVSQVVYSARASDVHTVLVNGQVVVEEGTLQTGKTKSIMKDAAKATERVVARAL